MKLKLIILSIIISISSQLISSHVSGGDIFFECVVGNQYRITLNVYRDCSGIDVSSSQTVSITNSCGYNNPTSITLDLIPNGNTDFTNISQLCSIDSLNSNCYNGSLPGMQMYTYTGIVTLPGPCNDWRFFWSTCCRNDAVNVNGASSDGTYIEALMNNTSGNCDNSPQFTSAPIPYVCVNQQVTYNFGAYDIDGDSISYTLIDARSGANGGLDYNGSYSGTSPLDGMTFNNLLGEIQFTPTVTGNFIVTVLVKEYDENNVLIGEVLRDMQFVVISCNNQIPDASSTAITNHTGDGTIVNSNTLSACNGDNFCLDLVFTDPDTDPTKNQLSISSNISSVLPNATMTVSGTNPATVTICVDMSNATNSNYVINFSVKDNACPIVGKTDYTLNINMIQSTFTTDDFILCLGESAQLNTQGGSSFTWSMISGEPISVGNNFSCNNCPNPLVSPSITSSYEVLSNLTGGCTNRDTIDITVVPNYSVTVNQSAVSSCRNSEVQFEIVTNPVGNYTYEWLPTTFLSDPTIANPTFNPTEGGDYTFYIDIVSDQGCAKQETLNMTVSYGVEPDFTVTTDMYDLQCKDTAQLDLNIDFSIATTEFTDNFEAGYDPTLWESVSNGSSDNPCGAHVGVNAMYFNGGTGSSDRYIESRDFNPSSCSEMNFCLLLGTGISAGCNQVDNSSPILLQESTNGGATWNSIRTYTPAIWNVDPGWKCFTVPMNGNSPTVRYRWIQPSYPGGNTANWAIDFVSFSCLTSDAYIYEWTPTQGLNDAFIKNPTSAPNDTTTYYVTVTDTTYGCYSIDSITINMNAEKPDVQFTADTLNGCNPLTIEFTNLTDPADVNTAVWNFGDGTTDGNANLVATHTYTTPGSYTVRLDVTSPTGCENFLELTDMIEVFASPVADFKANPQPTNITNSTIYYDNQSSSDAITYEWTFENGIALQTSSTDFEPIIFYPNDIGNSYLTKLVVQNEYGCIDSITKTIVIDNLFSLHVPNTFSPNSDSKNDLFFPIGEQIDTKDFYFRVFDRWGNLVFETTTLGAGWDGSIDGTPAVTDTYIWRLDLRDMVAKQKKTFIGHVNLIR